MKRTSGLFVVAVLAASTSAVRADSPSPFDVRTVPAAQTVSASEPVASPASTNDVVIVHGKEQRRVALWTAVGGGALIASSLTLSLIERGRYDSAIARGDIDGANSAANTARYAGTALFVGGAVTLGVAAAIYVTAPRLRERHVMVAPIASSENVGVALSGGF